MNRAALLTTAALALSGCSMLGLSHGPPTAVERGHVVARRDCAACHAVEPGRESPRPRAAPFGSVEMQHVAGLEGRVADLTRTGHYGMPPLKLAPGEAADLVAYIESLAQR